MRLLLFCIFPVLLISACESRKNVRSMPVCTYENGVLYSISNYVPGAEKRCTNNTTSGLQFLETYSRIDFLSMTGDSSFLKFEWLPEILSGEDISRRASPYSPDYAPSMEGPILCYADPSRKNALSASLEQSGILALLPPDMSFAWSLNPESQRGPLYGKYALYVIKAPSNKHLSPISTDVAEASVEKDENTGSQVINLTMTADGGSKWAQMTEKNTGKYIAIVFDGAVYTAPRVNGAITDGKVQISGGFSQQEAQTLADMINAYVMNGEYRIFHPNGKVKKIYTYEKGERVGGWSEYDEQGKLLQKYD